MTEENVQSGTDENENKPLPSGRTTVKILRPFKYNGQFVQEGQMVDMNEDRAVNHMRAGDVERNEELIIKVKQRRQAAAEAAAADAKGDW